MKFLQVFIGILSMMALAKGLSAKGCAASQPVEKLVPLKKSPFGFGAGHSH